MEFARQLGYSVKLLGIAKRCGPALELRVHPTLLPHTHLLAQVHGSMNAVMVHSDAAGTTLYYGAGAGAEQTGSAVVADLVDLARSHGVAPAQRVPALAFQHGALALLPVRDRGDVQGAFYLRLDLERAERTVPRVLQQLAQDGVCVEHMQRFEHPHGAGLQCLVLRTAPLRQRDLQAALDVLHAWPEVLGQASVLRLETLA